MKYRVQVGAFITHIAGGTYVVSAESEEEAIEKAKERFTKRQLSCARNNDVGEIMVDSIEMVE